MQINVQIPGRSNSYRIELTEQGQYGPYQDSRYRGKVWAESREVAKLALESWYKQFLPESPNHERWWEPWLYSLVEEHLGRFEFLIRIPYRD